MTKQKEGFKCVLCGQQSLGWGEHKQYGCNPFPLADKGECCDTCDKTKVIPARIAQLQERGA